MKRSSSYDANTEDYGEAAEAEVEAEAEDTSYTPYEPSTNADGARRARLTRETYIDGEGEGNEDEDEAEDADPLEASAESAHSFAAEDAFPDSPLKLMDCSVCGRRFREEVLARHVQSCTRNQKKRKPLDMRAKRMDAEAKDLALRTKMESRKSTGGSGSGSGASAGANKGKDWKRESEALRDAIRNAREVTTAIKEGGPLPAYQPSP
jgi:hypothetical protein